MDDKIRSAVHGVSAVGLAVSLAGSLYCAGSYAFIELGDQPDTDSALFLLPGIGFSVLAVFCAAIAYATRPK